MAFGRRRSQKLTVSSHRTTHRFCFEGKWKINLRQQKALQKIIIKDVNPVQFDTGITLIWYHK